MDKSIKPTSPRQNQQNFEQRCRHQLKPAGIHRRASFFQREETLKMRDHRMNQQNSRLGHVIRADPQDSMRSPTIDENLDNTGVYCFGWLKKRLNRVENTKKK